MGNEQDKDQFGSGSADEFSKSEDKQQIPTGGSITDGVDFAESLPGGGEDNEKSSLTVDDDKDAFDGREDDDEKS